MKVGLWLLDRLVPTLLMGASAALLTAGMLSYAPSAFGEWETPSPLIGGGNPLLDSPSPDSSARSGLPTDYPTDQPLTTEPPDAGPTPGSGPTPAPTVGNPGWPTPVPTVSNPGWPTPRPSATPGVPTPVPTPRPTGAPGSTPTPAPTPGHSGNAVAMRVVVPSLDIDLALVASNLVVPGDTDFYPLCDVAMYMVGFVNPGQAGTTYIYGHAQDGMFAPLLHASKYNDGASMIGALVQVYTNDNMLHLYEIYRVKRHATDLTITQIPAGTHQLVLQTSEGWHGHIPKLQVAARPLTVLPASYADAHPPTHPRVCLP